MALPDAVVGVFGYALYLAQAGSKHEQAKPLKGFGSGGVVEIVGDPPRTAADAGGGGESPAADAAEDFTDAAGRISGDFRAAAIAMFDAAGAGRADRGEGGTREEDGRTADGAFWMNSGMVVEFRK